MEAGRSPQLFQRERNRFSREFELVVQCLTAEGENRWIGGHEQGTKVILVAGSFIRLICGDASAQFPCIDIIKCLHGVRATL